MWQPNQSQVLRKRCGYAIFPFAHARAGTVGIFASVEALSYAIPLNPAWMLFAKLADHFTSANPFDIEQLTQSGII
jgi:hypothetical protein